MAAVPGEARAACHSGGWRRRELWRKVTASNCEFQLPRRLQLDAPARPSPVMGQQYTCGTRVQGKGGWSGPWRARGRGGAGWQGAARRQGGELKTGLSPDPSCLQRAPRGLAAWQLEPGHTCYAGEASAGSRAHLHPCYGGQRECQGRNRSAGNQPRLVDRRRRSCAARRAPIGHRAAQPRTEPWLKST